MTDTVHCVVQSERPRPHLPSTPPDVMVVDASRQTKDPHRSEVDIRMGFTHSPAKVVCHSPNAVHSDLRNTGDVQQACHINVDQVPTVSIGDGHQEDAVRHRHKSPAVIKEKAIAGDV